MYLIMKLSQNYKNITRTYMGGAASYYQLLSLVLSSKLWFLRVL